MECGPAIVASGDQRSAAAPQHDEGPGESGAEQCSYSDCELDARVRQRDEYDGRDEPKSPATLHGNARHVDQRG